MKNRKRLIVYSLLAIPFVVFGVFLLTLDPAARKGFFGEFRSKTAEHLGMVDTVPPQNSGAETAGGPNGENAGGNRGGGPGGRGGFDPEAIFAERDKDGDSKLTGDEISERMRENLERIDTDQDGSITLEEFRSGFGRGRRGGQGFDPAQFFSRQDENGDGKLTDEEIDDRMRENLADIDTDGDEAITLEEMEAGMEKLRASFGRGRGRGRRGGGPQDREGGTERPARPE